MLFVSHQFHTFLCCAELNQIVTNFLYYFRKKLVPISELFTEENLSRNSTYRIKWDLDHCALKYVFSKVAASYCTRLLGLSAEECSTEPTGCGLKSDNCEVGKICKNDASADGGTRCETRGINSSNQLFTIHL